MARLIIVDGQIYEEDGERLVAVGGALFEETVSAGGGPVTVVSPGPMQKIGSQHNPVAASRLNGVLQ